jgi:hypothetical protein
MLVGHRYRVGTHSTNIKFSYPTFYGTCAEIQMCPQNRYKLVKFIDITDYFHETVLNDKTIVVDLHDYLNLSGWMFMQLMKPELIHEIQKQRYKIASLANLCRKHITYKTQIEVQGTFISDVIKLN